MPLFLLFTVLALLVAKDSYAEMVIIDADTSYEAVFMPELFSTSVVIDGDDEPPVEPNITKVEFLKPPEVSDVRNRVDALLHGVTKDIPPEFDHYGYEIRRYMARSSNMKVFEDEEYIKQQIKNVRKARVIADFWRKSLEEEISALEEIIENDDGSVAFAVRTAFKQNKITITTFLISLQSWIDANEQLLLFIFNNPDLFEIYYPEIIIQSTADNLSFYNLLLVRQIKLKEIKAYRTFEMMVY